MAEGPSRCLAIYPTEAYGASEPTTHPVIDTTLHPLENIKGRPRAALFMWTGSQPILRSRRPSPRRRPGDVDHGHTLFLVVPAVEALDAGNFDLVEAEEARHVQRGRLLRLPDLGRAFFFLVQRLDADELSFLVVVAVRAGVAAGRA